MLRSKFFLTLCVVTVILALVADYEVTATPIPEPCHGHDQKPMKEMKPPMKKPEKPKKEKEDLKKKKMDMFKKFLEKFSS